MKESTLCYLIHDRKWLMLYRNKKKNDVNQGKWIGVGGKVEAGETVRECMIREIKEETGFVANILNYAGIVYFKYADHEMEKIWVYTCRDFCGNPVECNEGQLKWIDENEILSLNLWEGDKIFLKYMLSSTHKIFCLELHYDSLNRLIDVIEKEVEAE